MISSQPFECQITEVGDAGSGGINIAAVCMKVQYNKQANLENYINFIKAAAEKNVHLLVFPEQTMMGYLWETKPSWTLQPEVFNHQYLNAETVPGPVTDVIGEYARKYNMHIVIGMTEKDNSYAGGTAGLYNSAVLVGPEGIVGTYRKVHLAGGEKHIFIQGKGFRHFQVPFAKIGMMVCYDLNFPESARVYAIGGADIITFLTAWPAKLSLDVEDKPTSTQVDPIYDTLLTARAIENQIWVVSGATTGVDEKMGWEYYGHAKIINPCGEKLAETSEKEGLAIAYGLDIQGQILEARTTRIIGNNLLADRYPATYDLITRHREDINSNKGLSV